MICVLALFVFGILAIFSATHRPLFKEALSCVLKRVAFKKCESNLDQRIKSQVTGKLMRKNAKAASIVYKHFEILSWIFTILLIVSLVYSGISVYNLTVHGTCTPDSDGYCVFNELTNVETCECVECVNQDCESCNCETGECR